MLLLLLFVIFALCVSVLLQLLFFSLLFFVTPLRKVVISHFVLHARLFSSVHVWNKAEGTSRAQGTPKQQARRKQQESQMRRMVASLLRLSRPSLSPSSMSMIWIKSFREVSPLPNPKTTPVNSYLSQDLVTCAAP